MANEFTISLSLSGYKSSVMSSAKSRAIQAMVDSMSGTPVAEGILLVATSATVIPMGSVTAPHWAFFYNTDSTNFVKVRNGASGADVLKIRAQKANVCSLLDSGTFYAIADTAACYLEFLIFSL